MDEETQLKNEMAAIGIPKELLQDPECTCKLSKRGNIMLDYKEYSLVINRYMKKVINSSPSSLSPAWSAILPEDCYKSGGIFYNETETLPIGKKLTETIEKNPYRPYIDHYELIIRKQKFRLRIIESVFSPVNISQTFIFEDINDDETMAETIKDRLLPSSPKIKLRTAVMESFQEEWTRLRNILTENGLTLWTCEIIKALNSSKDDMGFIRSILRNPEPSNIKIRFLTNQRAIIAENSYIKLLYRIDTDETTAFTERFDRILKLYNTAKATLPIVKDILDRQKITVKTEETEDPNVINYIFSKKYDNFTGTYTAVNTPESLRETEKQIVRDYQKDRQMTDEKYDQIIQTMKENPNWGTPLTNCIVANIQLNDKQLTENAVVDTVRGMARKHEKLKIPAKYSGMFRAISDENVRKVIQWLKDQGVIRDYSVHGYYSNYRALQIKDTRLTEYILDDFEKSMNFSDKPKNDSLTDVELLAVLQDDTEFAGREPDIYLEILNHPTVFAMQKDAICEKFRNNAPESVKYYIKTAYEIEDGEKKAICAAIKKAL